MAIRDDYNNLAELMAGHRANLKIIGGTVINGIFMDCKDTLVPNFGEIDPDLAEFLKNYKEHGFESGHAITGGSDFYSGLLREEGVFSTGVMMGAKSIIAQDLAVQKARLEFLVDDSPSRDLPAVTTVWPSTLKRLLQTQHP